MTLTQTQIQIQNVPAPTPASLAHRVHIAQLISPLRRIRPNIPFYALAAHRLPTLWYLYRGLLQDAPSEHVKFRVRMMFRERRHTVNAQVAREQVRMGYKYLDLFRRAKHANSLSQTQKLRAYTKRDPCAQLHTPFQGGPHVQIHGDPRAQVVLARYSQMIAAKREKEEWKERIREALAYRNRLLNRPILKGSLLRSTHANAPLPRLYPQPHEISAMIAKRRRARARRMEAREELAGWARGGGSGSGSGAGSGGLESEWVRSGSECRGWLGDVYAEANFETRLQRLCEHEVNEHGAGGEGVNQFEPVFGGQLLEQWVKPLQITLCALHATFVNDYKRLSTLPSPALLHLLCCARADKVMNKTRERVKRVRGERDKHMGREVLGQTRGVPSWVLERWKRQGKMDSRMMMVGRGSGKGAREKDKISKDGKGS